MVITLNVQGTYGIRVNNPSGGQSNTFNFTTQAAVVTPSISSISPSSPTVSNSNQNVSVFGSNFQSGLTVTVFIPGGGTATLSGTQIQSVTSSSFTMVITLNVQGTYGIRVNNPSGGQSNTFNFTTQAAVVTPSISSISPSSPTVSNSDQNVSVFGSNFQSGLTVTVFIPGGGTATLSGSQIQGVTSGSFTMVITLNVVGQYGVRVNNPGGGQSTTFNFTTQPASSLPPSVSSISPSTPLTANTDQNVNVFGSNFQQNLTVSVTFPSGGGATLSGTQIQGVGANSFVMRITLGAPGAWIIRVNNPDGRQSSIFSFIVQSVIQQPSVSSLNPTSPFVNSNDQDVAVSGSNFQPNLTVSVTFPGGGGTTLSGTQILNVTPSAFVLRITLSATGNWSLRINNPDGGQSPVFNFNVAGGGQNPVINSLNPATPITSGADQNIIVSGSGFQSGLRVDVSFPSGGVGTLQGNGQIQNVIGNSFLMRITLNAAGTWTARVVNPDGTQSGQFTFNVQASGPLPSGLPSSVLSPVLGPLRMTTSNLGINDGKWEFNQHKLGSHSPTGGISLSNDTLAWDVNLYTPTSGNGDVGKAVFAVSDGEVVSYVGTPPGGGPGAVLIAHPNKSNPIWFSGYLHMTNVRVTLNQQVTPSTVVGEISRVGAENDHLHFVVYSGQDTRGNLQSFNATVLERSASTIDPPAISSIVPSDVVQSNDPQTLTINGANFQSSSIIEVEDPNGHFFTITPEPSSSVQQNARIVGTTAATITARVPFTFEGTYTLSVINRPTGSATAGLNDATTDGAALTGGSFALSLSNRVNVSPSLRRTPVIIIPGMMGSRIGERISGNFFDEIFPSLPSNSLQHLRLRNYIGYGNAIDQRPIVATDILKTYLGFKDVYGTLIDTLTGPYAGYRLYRESNPNQRTLSGCDLTQSEANLFVFPYDWRSSNDQSARDLKGMIDCIKKIYDPSNTNPNFKVNIIAHSMGGLVARRYILEGLYGTSQNYDPKVDKLVTLGTPWLGAPKFILALETGEAEGISTGTPRLILQNTLKEVARYMPGAHELIPSRAYANELRDTNLGDFPFGENGWDFNRNNRPERIYDFDAIENLMNGHTPDGIVLPGTNTDLFHNKHYLNKSLQDNWTGDQTGITYYNFVGRCLNNRGELNTIGSIIATSEWYKDFLGIWREKKYLSPKMSRGDCTVPEISGMRQSNNGNYLGPAIAKVFDNVEHGGLPNDSRIISTIDCLFAGASSSLCFAQQTGAYNLEDTAQIVSMPAYNLKILGSTMVTISDSFGNTTNPFSTSNDEGVATISTTVTGQDFLSSVIPLDQNYKVVIRTSDSPLVITVTKTEGQDTTLAIRYLDLPISPGVLALLEITPQGVTMLKYDSDGDGIFDTSVSPTISVTGAAAQDIEPPVVTVNETSQSGASQIALTATDAGAGVQRIMFSLNGTTYQPYTVPFTVNPSQTAVVYAFADDNVANRSGVVTYYASPSGNQADNAQFFVHQHYLDFLNREPDPDGLAFWTNQITSCGSDSQCIELKRINVSAAYFLSIEFQETGYLVYRMYKAAYGNLPGAPVPVRLIEFLPDTQQIGTGVQVGIGNWQAQLENNKVAFGQDFVSRARFSTAFPTTMTPAALVDTLFANAGVTPSAAQRTAAIDEFGGAGTSADNAARGRALRRVAENSVLAQQETNKAFVLMQYFGYLRRNPNDAPEAGLNFDGYNFWLGKLNQFNGNFVNAEMVKAFIVSAEYRQRFGP
jgi:pimeloyl-ACP methyl ester carboxylesterase